MASHVLTASILGLEAHAVHVECDISPGLGAFIIVGLPDTAIQEAKERVKSALKHADMPFPRTRVTVNLAPADLKKTGTPFDLPIALAILLAEGHVPEETTIKRLFAGELGLNGALRPIQGALSFAMLARDLGMDELIVPNGNGSEAAMVEGLIVRTSDNLKHVIAHLQGTTLLEQTPCRPLISAATMYPFDFAAIRGQEQARRALEIAAAGGHNLVMQGPPGSGKTLLARAFPSILPSLTPEETLETTRIHSVAGSLPASGMMIERPFRAPHHSASMVSIVGGGAIPRPGEVSLAHRGVLFLNWCALQVAYLPANIAVSFRSIFSGRFMSCSHILSICHPAIL